MVVVSPGTRASDRQLATLPQLCRAAASAEVTDGAAPEPVAGRARSRGPLPPVTDERPAPSARLRRRGPPTSLERPVTSPGGVCLSRAGWWAAWITSRVSAYTCAHLLFEALHPKNRRYGFGVAGEARALSSRCVQEGLSSSTRWSPGSSRRSSALGLDSCWNPGGLQEQRPKPLRDLRPAV